MAVDLQVSPSVARWACAGHFALAGAAFGSVTARMPALKFQMGLDELALGQALLALGLGALTAFPLTGFLVSRLGSRRVATGGAIAALAFLPVLGASQQWWQFALMLYLFGFGGGMLDVAMNTQGVEIEKVLGKPCMSSLHAMFSAGGLLGAALASLLTGLSPLLHFTLLAALLALTLLPIHQRLLRLATGRRAAKARFQRPGKPILWLGGLALCAFVAEGAIADWGAVFMTSYQGASERTAALAYAAFSATMVGGRLFGDRLRARYADQALLRLAGALATCGWLLAILAPTPAWSIAGFALVGVGLSVIVPVLFSAAGKLMPGQPQAAVATVATFGYGGLLLGPPLIGMLAHVITLHWALLIIVVLSALLSWQARRVTPPAA